ncbi:MAG: DEAD/DEAH box helicase [Pyrinomonadaceae bacterium]
MIELKNYQNRVLDSLRKFLKVCSQTGNAEAAFREVTTDEDTETSVPYEHVNVAGLSELPYVCLRVPTGGGKTLLACHAAGIAMKELLHADRSVALWLVPSNTILDQTADALRNPRHPHRRALELECGTVEVLTIEEALHLSRAAVDGQTVVIVSTIQSFRVEDKTGRRVYAENGSLLEHFVDVPTDRLGELDKRADGSPIPSLANALRLRRPVVIVDEAHNARTDLSFATLASVSPACIIEFTATPATKENRSNVLHRVSAAELKAAQMIKLPLRVVTQAIGQKDQLLSDAIGLRADLERVAISEGQATGEYVRPILLIQAERVDACEPLCDRMVQDFNIGRDEIKISTGKLDQLKSVEDINAPDCPVRFIITVEKLREGWDCPFAYALCSLKETRSATAIEQIVGRILRLPHAGFKQDQRLNCAYVFSVSDSINEVLAELRDALQGNGFTKAEAQRIILAVPQRLPLSVQPQTIELDTATEIDSVLAQAQAIELTGKVQFDSKQGALTILVPLTTEEEEKVKIWGRTPEAQDKIAETIELVRQIDAAFGEGKPRSASPFELSMGFFVPLLSVREGQAILPFDSTILLEHEWKLSEKDASLEKYDPLERPVGRSGVLDVSLKGEVETNVVQQTPDFITTLHQQVLNYGVPGDWSFNQLAVFLDSQIRHPDITSAESIKFIQKALRGLMSTFDVSDVGTLALDRFRLRDALEARIDEHRKAERQAVFQSLLLPDSALTVDSSRGIDFRTSIYEPTWLYKGSFQFQKHYFGQKPGELPDNVEGDCAQFIDGLPEVKYWVRNLSKKPNSFRLPTSKDWFYPDFVCRLTDGRLLVVEYKGEHLYTDAEEKRLAGQAWESRSDGRCLFIMLTRRDFSDITTKTREGQPRGDEFKLTG